MGGRVLRARRGNRSLSSRSRQVGNGAATSPGSSHLTTVHVATAKRWAGMVASRERPRTPLSTAAGGATRCRSWT